MIKIKNLRKGILKSYSILSFEVPWRVCRSCGYEGYFSSRCPVCASVQ